MFWTRSSVQSDLSVALSSWLIDLSATSGLRSLPLERPLEHSAMFEDLDLLLSTDCVLHCVSGKCLSCDQPPFL